MPSAAPDPAPLTPPVDPAQVARFAGDLASRRPLGGGERIGIAVSGGPDSLALLLLAAAAFPGRIEAATVDHGLRAESAGEARMVAGVCADLGVPHAILKGDWPPDAGIGLQAAARAYRYRELAGWCARRGLALLATAHHADDQAETLLLRLARGAGTGGLGAIRPVRRLADDGGRTMLVRPLLRFAKHELTALVAAAGLVAVDDPSNDSDRFDRTRARRLLAQTPWLDPARLAASASHLADADLALDWAANLAFDRRVASAPTADRPSEWRLDPAGLPDEILRRVVRRLILAVENHATDGHSHADPAGPELSRFVRRLQRGDTATMWHVLARPGTLWRFAAAPPRRA